MPGKGPPPKLGSSLGHISRAQKDARAEWDEIAELAEEAHEPRPCPRGEWHHKAREWWNAVADSLGARVLWMDEDWAAAERGLKLVNEFWLTDSASKMTALSAEVRRLEVQLYCTPADRVRQGLRPGGVLDRGQDRHPSAGAGGSGDGARARLRALEGGTAG